MAASSQLHEPFMFLLLSCLTFTGRKQIRHTVLENSFTFFTGVACFDSTYISLFCSMTSATSLMRRNSLRKSDFTHCTANLVFLSSSGTLRLTSDLERGDDSIMDYLKEEWEIVAKLPSSSTLEKLWLFELSKEEETFKILRWGSSFLMAGLMSTLYSFLSGVFLHL